MLRAVRAADAPTPLQVARLKFDERAVSDVFKPLVTIVGDTLPETHHPSRR